MSSAGHPHSDADHERALHRVLDSLGQRLGRRIRNRAQKFNDGAEYRSALEEIVDGLRRDDVVITQNERSELLQLAGELHHDRAAAAIELCILAPAQPPATRLDAVVRAIRRIGHGLFYLLMSAVLLGSVGMGVAGVKDVVDKQPVLSGTFSEQDCQPTLHGCRSIGTWVSDDGSIIKERVYLDGSPGQDGTVRATYQPSGAFNDNDNNVVHVKWTRGAVVWFPWVLAAGSLGLIALLRWSWRGSEVPR